MKGFVIIVRDCDTSGIVVDVVEDWEDFMEETSRRLIYCQAVGNLEGARDAVDDFLNSYVNNEDEDVCQQIAELVSSVQWIANDFPLQSFTKKT